MRPRSLGRIAFALTLLLTALGPLGAPDRAGAAPPTSPPFAAASQSPPSQPRADVNVGSAAQVVGTEGDGLRVRGLPSLEGAVDAVLVEGAQVEVLEGPVPADSFRWYRVRYDRQGATGWVAGQFLTATMGSPSGARAPTTGGSPDGATVPATTALAAAAASAPLPPSAALPAPVAPGTVALPGALTDAPGGTELTIAAGSPVTEPVAAVPGRYVRLGAYPAASPEYGLNVFIWGEPNTTQRDLGKLRELGFGWQKTLFQWREIEGAGKGQYDWREADRVVSASTAAGIKIFARIDFPPLWACPRWDGRGNECAPERLEDYADFIRAFTTRYGTGSPIGRVHAVEIWNEPNLAREWSNQPVNEAQAREYVRLLQLAYQAAKSVDPQMTIVTAGLTPTGTQSDEARPDDVYLQWMYDAGAAAFFDVLGAHGAGYRAPPHMSPDEVTADRSYGGHASFAFRRVEHLREVMVRNGDDMKQVWLLEFGWTSDEVHPSYAWHRVTEDQKAEYIVNAFRWARDNWTPWIGVMALWNLSAPGWSRDNEEFWWSISNADGSPRPAYTRLLDARQSGLLP